MQRGIDIKRQRDKQRRSKRTPWVVACLCLFVPILACNFSSRSQVHQAKQGHLISQPRFTTTKFFTLCFPLRLLSPPPPSPPLHFCFSSSSYITSSASLLLSPFRSPPLTLLTPPPPAFLLFVPTRFRAKHFQVVTHSCKANSATDGVPPFLLRSVYI